MTPDVRLETRHQSLAIAFVPPGELTYTHAISTRSHISRNSLSPFREPGGLAPPPRSIPQKTSLSPNAGALPCLRRRCFLLFRFNVLIDTEKIVRVVLGFYSLQTFIVAAITRLDTILTFFHHEVHVCATGVKWVHRLPVFPGPA